jgi:hypothetical protein
LNNYDYLHEKLYIENLKIIKKEDINREAIGRITPYHEWTLKKSAFKNKKNLTVLRWHSKLFRKVTKKLECPFCKKKDILWGHTIDCDQKEKLSKELELSIRNKTLKKGINTDSK